MIQKYIPFSFKAELIYRLFTLKTIKGLAPFKMPKKDHKRIFIFLAADYGNLGDVAITYAQTIFLKNSYPDYFVQEIPISMSPKGLAFAKKILHPTDIITTVGGGNMGDLYPQIECYRQMVIKKFKKNLIISFPQTIDFSESQEGQLALQKAIRAYSKHPNLILLAREQKSYDFFNTHFKQNKTLLVPDIVLTLDKIKSTKNRKGVTICLRDDKEKKLSIPQEETLLKIIKEEFGEFKKRDTHIGGFGIPLLTRVRSLFHIWDDFKASELVITDRLHGMIFCHITGTPALVFLNNNHKIKSSFKWIEDTKHIHLVEDFSEEKIIDLINDLKSQETKTSKKDLLPFYKELRSNVVMSQ